MDMEESSILNALLTTLSHLAERLSQTTTPAEVLSAVVDGTRGLLPFTACALVLPEPWRVWRTPSARPDHVTYSDQIPPAACQTLERFLSQGNLLRVDDLLLPPWSQTSYRDVLWKDGTRSAFLIPLVAGKEILGILSFTSMQPNRYPIIFRERATLLAWMVAVTVRTLPAPTPQPSDAQQEAS